MEKQVVVTNQAPSAIGPYSQGIAIGDLIFTSGQLPLNSETNEMVEDIQKATAQSIENVAAILKAAGSDLDHVVKTVVFLRDMNDFAAMNEVYGRYFNTNPPARSCVQVAQLPKNAILEIEAIAYRG